MTTNIKNSKDELNKSILQFDKFEFDDKKFITKIKASVAIVNQELHKLLVEYQQNLIANKNWIFEFKESSIEDIFGRVIDH